MTANRPLDKAAAPSLPSNETERAIIPETNSDALRRLQKVILYFKKNRRWLGWKDLSLVTNCATQEAVSEFMSALSIQSDLNFEEREDGSWRLAAKHRKKVGLGNLFD